MMNHSYSSYLFKEHERTFCAAKGREIEERERRVLNFMNLASYIFCPASDLVW